MERREGINWKELWVLLRVLETWGTTLAGKLVLPRMDNCTAVAYTNYGARRASTLAAIARVIKERDVALGHTVVALRIAGKDNAAADALSRVSVRVRGLDPFPGRGLRWSFRRDVQHRCGAIDVDMLASDDGRNACVRRLKGRYPTADCGGSREPRWRNSPCPASGRP